MSDPADSTEPVVFLTDEEYVALTEAIGRELEAEARARELQYRAAMDACVDSGESCQGGPVT